MNVQPHQRVQLVDGIGVVRVAGCYRQGAVVAGDRHQVFAVEQLQRHRNQRLGFDFRLCEIDPFHPEFFGENRQEDLFLHEAFFDEREMRSFVGRSGHGIGGTRDIGIGKDAALR